MNYWDILPEDIKSYIYKFSLVILIEKNWIKNPCFKAKCTANSLMNQEYGIHVICPVTAEKLEFCAKYSGKQSDFWIEFSMKVLEALIIDMWSTDMGHGWINRCQDAHNILIKKYNIRASYDQDDIVGKLSRGYFTRGQLMLMENVDFLDYGLI